jgi:hypothetical protein
MKRSAAEIVEVFGENAILPLDTYPLNIAKRVRRCEPAFLPSLFLPTSTHPTPIDAEGAANASANDVSYEWGIEDFGVDVGHVEFVERAPTDVIHVTSDAAVEEAAKPEESAPLELVLNDIEWTLSAVSSSSVTVSEGEQEDATMQKVAAPALSGKYWDMGRSILSFIDEGLIPYEFIWDFLELVGDSLVDGSAALRVVDKRTSPLDHMAAKPTNLERTYVVRLRIPDAALHALLVNDGSDIRVHRLVARCLHPNLITTPALENSELCGEKRLFRSRVPLVLLRHAPSPFSFEGDAVVAANTFVQSLLFWQQHYNAKLPMSLGSTTAPTVTSVNSISSFGMVASLAPVPAAVPKAQTKKGGRNVSTPAAAASSASGQHPATLLSSYMKAMASEGTTVPTDVPDLLPDASCSSGALFAYMSHKKLNSGSAIDAFVHASDSVSVGIDSHPVIFSPGGAPSCLVAPETKRCSFPLFRYLSRSMQTSAAAASGATTATVPPTSAAAAAAAKAEVDPYSDMTELENGEEDTASKASGAEDEQMTDVSSSDVGGGSTSTSAVGAAVAPGGSVATTGMGFGTATLASTASMVTALSNAAKSRGKKVSKPTKVATVKNHPKPGQFMHLVDKVIRPWILDAPLQDDARLVRQVVFGSKTSQCLLDVRALSAGRYECTITETDFAPPPLPATQPGQPGAPAQPGGQQQFEALTRRIRRVQLANTAEMEWFVRHFRHLFTRSGTMQILKDSYIQPHPRPTPAPAAAPPAPAVAPAPTANTVSVSSNAPPPSAPPGAPLSSSAPVVSSAGAAVPVPPPNSTSSAPPSVPSSASVPVAGKAPARQPPVSHQTSVSVTAGAPTSAAVHRTAVATGQPASSAPTTTTTQIPASVVQAAAQAAQTGVPVVSTLNGQAILTMPDGKSIFVPAGMTPQQAHTAYLRQSQQRAAATAQAQAQAQAQGQGQAQRTSAPAQRPVTGQAQPGQLPAGHGTVGQSVSAAQQAQIQAQQRTTVPVARGAVPLTSSAQAAAALQAASRPATGAPQSSVSVSPAHAAAAAAANARAAATVMQQRIAAGSGIPAAQPVSVATAPSVPPSGGSVGAPAVAPAAVAGPVVPTIAPSSSVAQSSVLLPSAQLLPTESRSAPSSGTDGQPSTGNTP